MTWVPIALVLLCRSSKGRISCMQRDDEGQLLHGCIQIGKVVEAELGGCHRSCSERFCVEDGSF